jgi:hypothetical protein
VDDIARGAAGDRADLFNEASSRCGNIGPVLVEKDFWVCWALKRMFTMVSPPAGLILKGGTSLSKVYRAIDRFSEDVDLSFDRAGPGFGGTNDPANASSRKQADKRVEELAAACRAMIREVFLPRLEATLTEELGMAAAPGTWEVKLDPDDPDQQTLLFRYPSGVGLGEGLTARYLRPVVRLELGARADHWPAEHATITSYAAEELAAPFREPICEVKVLAAERTFWEKATILHACFHQRPDKPLASRQSRHYYDVVRLYGQGIGKTAVQNLDLLASVAKHKSVFFRSAGAKYEEATPGSLRLVPPVARRTELETDYAKMREMIFTAPPTFSELMDALATIEDAVNRGR